MNKKTILLLSSIAIALTTLSACNSESIKVENNTAQSPTDIELQSLIDFNSKSALEQVRFINSSAQPTPDNQGLTVNFDSQKNSYSGIALSPETPWDWSQKEDFNLAIDIANHGKHSVQLFLDITDIDGGTYTRSINVPVGDSNTYYAKMAGHDLATPEGEEGVELNFTSGLRGNPDTWESDDIQFISLWGKKNLNLKGIKQISLSVQSNLFDKEITLSNLRLRKNPDFNPAYLTNIVDKYGQNATVDFPSKIHTDQDLLNQKNEEAKHLTGLLPKDRSQYGGWKTGPKLKATGYFRTEKVDGVWSLVDPDGYLYFATGIDVIRLSNSSTMTGYDFDQALIAQRSADNVTPEDSQGLNRVSNEIAKTRELKSQTRADLFEWLPTYDESLGKHFGYRISAHSGPMKHGETFSFYSANLERKYGNNGESNQAVMDKWVDVTLDRMIDWGFTSLGNWNDPMFYHTNKVPFFANGWIIGDFKTVSSGDDFWGAMPDVFDPVFEERAQFTVKTVAEQVKNNPWCVGVFIDNEKSFGRPGTPESTYGIVISTLKRDGKDVPTKAVFTRLMKEKYVDIAKLNKAWGKNIESWATFDKGINSDINNEVQIEDYSTLLSSYVDKYFSVVESALTQHMPNHLYLGARLPNWAMSDEVIEASAKYADVVSYNIYKEGLAASSWDFLSQIDKPSIIGEFHIGAMDTGLYHPGLVMASDQEDRAKMYKDYMHSVIDNPYFIGAHWFQYIDSPISGRAYDGENYNVGFITVTDTPYAPMVEAAKELHSTMYERRFK
ncbi:beta-galactosidase [Colwellia sp. E2M01]|uniref:beta-galactosidase n=1 Tax=Colwellia sp. E2M01 TaxID=2841561 RepID=UPI001C091F8B|nr:beta-galactosidase [Colwellia sp. E2M01]MBU2872043.1 beta-galactosidase [Colwellia sp. E2M01]